MENEPPAVGSAMSMPRSLSRFVKDRRGSIVPLFALAIIPVIGFVGAAVDYSRGNSTKAAMQAALDATGLLLSKEANSLNQSQLTQKANAYFTAQFHRPEARGLVLTPTLTALANGGYRIDIASVAYVDTTFIRLIGQPDMKITATTQIVWGYKKLELALALDNTGSMAWSGKMVELKKAVNALLGILEKAAKTPDDIKVAIVPFDTMVRVDDKKYANVPWIVFDSQKEKNTWNGCLEDRDQSNDVSDTTPNLASSSTLFPAKKCSGSGGLQTLQPLTNDWKALKLTVNGMNPNGNTNVTIGLVWAWHALTQNLPLTEALPPDPNLEKVIVLLTDGENTQNRWTKNSSAIDNRTKAACNNIKATGIKLYAIRVIEGDAALLQSCATNPTMYYDVQQASQLNAVFTAIAESLANLRIAK